MRKTKMNYLAIGASLVIAAFGWVFAGQSRNDSRIDKVVDDVSAVRIEVSSIHTAVDDIKEELSRGMQGVGFKQYLTPIQTIKTPTTTKLIKIATSTNE